MPFCRHCGLFVPGLSPPLIPRAHNPVRAALVKALKPILDKLLYEDGLTPPHYPMPSIPTHVSYYRDTYLYVVNEYYLWTFWNKPIEFDVTMVVEDCSGGIEFRRGRRNGVSDCGEQAEDRSLTRDRAHEGDIRNPPT